ncbi:ankyrin repeat domain-containing protein [Lysobacter sp. K5869]|uniref:ankyrin repeat domain-containing protein n=1 Tax=Lysobacter sp. K5869 TaxID=2820808 RepID=UPI001C061359|nr:ankyrin repeat domain-containing protein [Lysobacter sp. K5869]QWP77826.1 ankyrin repeat domain-containing protein [Lysobacter sp. K5869]
MRLRNMESPEAATGRGGANPAADTGAAPPSRVRIGPSHRSEAEARMHHHHRHSIAARGFAAVLGLWLCAAAAFAQPGVRAMRASQAFSSPAAAGLAQAAADGDAARVRALVAAGADPNARGERGITVLQWALYQRSVDGLRALLAAGADPARGADDGTTVLQLAAMADDPKYLRALLEAKVDPNLPNTVTGANALAAALTAERADHFAALLAAGADPGHADRVGNTPLHVAAKINEFGHALALLRAGADPKARNAQGATFQRYMFMSPDRLLNAKTRAERGAVADWLGERGIGLENAAGK